MKVRDFKKIVPNLPDRDRSITRQAPRGGGGGSSIQYHFNFSQRSRIPITPNGDSFNFELLVRVEFCMAFQPIEEHVSAEKKV